MIEAILEYIESETQAETDGCGDQFDRLLGSFDFDEVAQNKDRYNSSLHDIERARTEQILSAKIEYISSPYFAKPGAADEILAPYISEANGSKKSSLPKAPSGTPPYLAALYAIPLLTREQEHHLFRKMNYLKYSADQLRKKLNPQRPQTAALDQIEKMLDDALKIRNGIVQANLRLVVSIAKKVVDRANSFEDMVSDGNVPLIRAAEIFDFERGTRFSTYATWAIRNSLYRSTPRNRRDCKRYVTGSEGVFESATESGSLEQVQENRHREIQVIVKSMLSRLDSRDRKIVISRFGLGGDAEPRKFREIAEGLEISTERVRQLLERSIGRMLEFPELSAIELD